MNKILVENNCIKNVDMDDITIKDNHIFFKYDGDYEIEYHHSDKFNYVIEVYEDVHVNLFIYSENNDMNIENTIILNEKSNLLLLKFYYNKNVNEKLEVNLNGRLSKLDYCFSNIASNKENYYQIINHNAKETISNISNKSITINNAKLDFTIDSNVRKNISKCTLNQATKIITLDGNNSTIRPNMYIDIDDVNAKHSSVIGKFNKEDIFYLMTRGINYDDSVKLLIKGYILSNLNVNIEKRAKILKIINSLWR